MARPPRTAYAPRALDIAAFCRDGGRLEGQAALADLPRFADSVLRSADGAPEAPVLWRAAGSLQAVAGGPPQCLVDLTLSAAPTLECQRCLQPVAVRLEIERRIRFVQGEDAAARLDEELEDDVLALLPRFDLLALVEDELLLALPLVPRHETCPDLPAALRPEADVQAAAAGAGSELPSGRSEHPFAVLAALRRPKS